MSEDMQRAQPEEPGWREVLGVALGSVALTLLFFHRAAFTEQIFIARDIQRVYYPLHQYWAERVAAGEVPLWYPYDGLGQPFVAMMISSALHPSNLLYLVLPLAGALKLNVLGCYPVAFCGAWRCARHWGAGTGAALLAGSVFAFNGYMVSITNNLPYLMAAATFPWALWAADSWLERPSLGRAVGAALLACGVLLAGDSQSFVLCCALVGALALGRAGSGGGLRSLGAGAAVLGLTALYACAQVLPAASVLGDAGLRDRPLEEALHWSVHPLRLLELALGPLFAYPMGSKESSQLSLGLLQTQRSMLWVHSLHVGAVGVVLAVAGLWAWRRRWQVWAAVGLAVLYGLLMLGRWTPAYALVFEWVPLWRPFRYPEKIFPYVAFFLALGCAAGAQAVRDSERLRRGVSLALLACVGVCLVLERTEAWGSLVTREWLPALWQKPQPSEATLQALSSRWQELWGLTGLLCLATGVLLRVRSARLPQPVLLAAVLFPLLVCNEPLYELTFPELLEEPNAFIQAVREQEPEHRLGGARIYSSVDGYRRTTVPGVEAFHLYSLGVETALHAVGPARWGFESADPYLAIASQRYMALMAAPIALRLERLVGLAGARYVTLPSDVYAQIGGNAQAVVADHPTLGMVLLRNPRAVPRAYLAAPRCVPDAQSSLRALVTEPLDPLREAVVECPQPLPQPEPGAALGQARLVSYAPERVEVHAQVEAPSVLVLADAYYSGWEVEVDGQPAQILPANHAMRAVPLGPGSHQVVFRYRSLPFLWGAGISLTSLGATLAALALGALRRRAVAGHQGLAQ